MNDNVIVLGAGFSYDAKIPLLGTFLERMWSYSQRRQAGGEPLSEADRRILDAALEVGHELDGYHRQVSFDDRNIEDVLSMLAFNVLGGDAKEKEKMSIFVQAISRTIELSCQLSHPGIIENPRTPEAVLDGDPVYRAFWQYLFKYHEEYNYRSMPSIISLNYDLVLERSLFQLLIGSHMRHKNFNNIKRLSLDYHREPGCKFFYELKLSQVRSGRQLTEGKNLVIANKNTSSEFMNIDLLKLHGSLNFSAADSGDSLDATNITNSVLNPLIIPPVSNKTSDSAGEPTWRRALQCLREAKNIVFVGYSLPETDMYMKYFLKAALGPNRDLNKVTIFDPLLWTDSEASLAMRHRYELCFSEQMRKRIVFRPPAGEFSSNLLGTTKHFVKLLDVAPQTVLF